jgi:hypothetical protein
MSATILACLLRNQENDDARVAIRITGLASLADFPLATDLQTHFLRVARPDVGKGYYRDLARRLRPNILRDLLHVSDRIRRQNVREIIHQPRWGGNLDSSLKK